MFRCAPQVDNSDERSCSILPAALVLLGEAYQAYHAPGVEVGRVLALVFVARDQHDDAPIVDVLEVDGGCGPDQIHLGPSADPGSRKCSAVLCLLTARANCARIRSMACLSGYAAISDSPTPRQPGYRVSPECLPGPGAVTTDVRKYEVWPVMS